VRKVQNDLAGHLGATLHMSRRKARMHQIEPFRALFCSDREFAALQVFLMDLADEEVAALLGEKDSSKAVKEIRAAVDAMESKKAEASLAWAVRKRPEGQLPEPDDAPGGSTDAEGTGGRLDEDAAGDAPTRDEPDSDASKRTRPKPSDGQQRLF
jgi:hypothetical protein